MLVKLRNGELGNHIDLQEQGHKRRITHACQHGSNQSI